MDNTCRENIVNELNKCCEDERSAQNQNLQAVTIMEQIMSTGGGWQDQVGGIVSGIKMVTTRPGLAQKITWGYTRGRVHIGKREILIKILLGTLRSDFDCLPKL